jgi:hypothetical protein
VDSFGNFSKLVAYEIFRGKTDTTCIWESIFDEKGLNSSMSFEEGHFARYYCQKFDDTLFEYIQSGYVGYEKDTIYCHIKANISLKQSPRKVAFFPFQMNCNNVTIDSVRKEFYSTNNRGWWVVEFNASGVIRKEFVSRDGDVTWLCLYGRINHEYQKRTCTNSQEKTEQRVPTKHFIPFTKQMRFEQYIDYCLNPYEFIKSNVVPLEIEYFK